MGVIRNEDETVEDAVRRELSQDLTGLRAANLLDSASVKDVERLESHQSASPESEEGQ
ncbi:hypothetical protein [Haloarcula sp. Atlit-7R]|uniref:hypothetical protein n=1 Tax=Haloarcula sp. Atlit-7R TaxID=2282125 RepID=UPI001313E897|nr:hypothetical protein [Haloarcula sp. Atlit-7R]